MKAHFALAPTPPTPNRPRLFQPDAEAGPDLGELLADASSDETFFLSGPTLARLFHLPEEALRKRLLRWRNGPGREPLRDEDRSRGGAGVYYNLRDVLQVIRGMAEDLTGASGQLKIARN